MLCAIHSYRAEIQFNLKIAVNYSDSFVVFDSNVACFNLVPVATYV